MIVAIHQPNYAPWLGYFAKMARADVFVLLDDAQFSKNSYINRVQIDGGGAPRWLTVPIRHRFGEPILAVSATTPAWARAHLDTLKTYYSKAPHFAAVWRWLSEIYASLPAGSLADSNVALIRALAQRLGLAPALRRSSEIAVTGARGDDRLIALVRACGGTTYLSGRGGANYQSEAKFAASGLTLRYSDFAHPRYDQGRADFVPGLSILDALFRRGWDETAAMISCDALAA